ncbi:hypothetical protein V491_02039 [Pseudogymnoascus sp. VKM F-3775]|nr:hypothetical protein V491_02039 [Pseudogymnoascus sp. VKM F-3775]
MAARPGITKQVQQTCTQLLKNNRSWAVTQREKDPEYFKKLAEGQSPEYLWIGCSDSRIPAEQITGMQPGEAFVHRNIANLVCNIDLNAMSVINYAVRHLKVKHIIICGHYGCGGNLVCNIDLNAMSVINYAVRHLKVKHIIVCGHYGCGGVEAAMKPQDLGLLNPWLRNIRDVYRLHEAELDKIADKTARYDRLVELNVIEQCHNVIKTAAVQQSYAANQFPVVSGWVFRFQDGLIKDLKIDFQAVLKDVRKIYDLTL